MLRSCGLRVVILWIMRTYALLLSILLCLPSNALAEGALYAASKVDLAPSVSHPLRASAAVESILILPGRKLIFTVENSRKLFTQPVPTDQSWDLTPAQSLPISLPADASLALTADSLDGSAIVEVRVHGSRVGAITLTPPRYFALTPLSEESAVLADLDGDGAPDRLSVDLDSHTIKQHFADGRVSTWFTLPADFRPTIVAALHLNSDREADLLAVDARNRWCVMLSGDTKLCELRNGYQGNKEIPVSWTRPTVVRIGGASTLAILDPLNEQWAIASPSYEPIDQFRWLGALPVGMAALPLASADFTGDGNDDLLIAPPESRFPLLLQSGPGPIEHELRGAQLPLFSDRMLGAADVDGDSLADLTIFSRTAQSLWIATVNRLVSNRADSPQACIGFNPGINQRWGRISRAQCPRGYAVMEADDVSGRKGFDASTMGSLCCPLAADDLLTDEVSVNSIRCPENSVVVGNEFDGTRFSLRCAQINTARYRLAASASGVYWGLGFSRPIYGSGFISKQQLPAALRYGVGRRSLRAWDPDGCVGTPAGALLVGREGTGCRGLKFAEVLDKNTGAPVALLPTCRAVQDIFAERPRCLR